METIILWGFIGLYRVIYTYNNRDITPNNGESNGTEHGK